MSKNNPIKDVLDLVSGVKEFVEENDEQIESVQRSIEGILGEFGMEDDRPSMSAVTAEGIEVAVDVGYGVTDENVSLEQSGDDVTVSIVGGTDMTIKVPDDSLVDEAESTVSNGILTVTIPRGDNNGNH